MDGKLVRDKIPELFNLTDNYIASESEYHLGLMKKLEEESAEYAHDQNIEELADVMEVVHAIAKFRGHPIESIEKIRKEKAEKRGSFDKRIIWRDPRLKNKDLIRLNSNAIVTNNKGKFLLVRLRKGPFAGGLCIPGGGVELGELSHEAAKREVLEETGVEVDSDKFSVCGFCELKHNQSGKQKVVMLLHANAEGTPKNTEEGEAMWMTYEEAKPGLIIFADEAIKMWKEGRSHFRIVNEKLV